MIIMERTIKIFGMLLALFLALNQILAVSFKMTNAVCESYNQSWVVFNRCKLRAVHRNNVTLNVNATMIYPAYNINLRVEVMKKANGYKPWLVNITIDACDFMRRRHNPYVKMIYNLFKDASTINHTCPYMDTQLLKDFWLNSEKLPIPLPTGDYVLLLTWIFDQKPQAITNVYFTFVEDFKGSRAHYGSRRLPV